MDGTFRLLWLRAHKSLSFSLPHVWQWWFLNLETFIPSGLCFYKYKPDMVITKALLFCRSNPLIENCCIFVKNMMGYDSSRSVRFTDDLELAKHSTVNEDGVLKLKYSTEYNMDGTQMSESNSDMTETEVPGRTAKFLIAAILSRVFSEDFERTNKKMFDPRGHLIRRWSKIFLIACLVSLFVDPIFFYLPSVSEEACVDMRTHLKVLLTIVRSVADVFYMIQIYIRFHTAYIAPSSRVLGRGELVIDPKKIALRYLQKNFWIDLIAALPLPQVLIWIVIPYLGCLKMTNTQVGLWFIIICQYLPRLLLIFPLSSQIVKTTGVMTEAAWAGAVYNLMLFMLASHVLGACWYLLSLERQEACWISVCNLENPSCQYRFLDCHQRKELDRESWFKSSNVKNLCNPDNNYYQFGIYGDALNYGVTSSPFFHKYFYCLWWGLRNLSSLGQNLSTSTYIGEIGFSIIVAILGLVLFALLIGNMQMYLQSTTIRFEQWRIMRTDTEQWMRHRQLPPELRQSVRKYDQYKWMATRGVDEESLLKDLPTDIRRDIKRHLCLDLVRRVPLFDEMDERMLDAVCERLKPALRTEGTSLVREGDPVNEMLFIIRGNLDSYTTNGGRTGFFNSCRIGPGDFCGEELLTWALDPRPSLILPSSTRTVKSISEVEAFALIADDLKFVASQFRRLHSKQVRHKFRFYSHQWRLWAASFIQAAWRRHKKGKEAAELTARAYPTASHQPETTPPASVVAMHSSRLATSSRKGIIKRSTCDSCAKNPLQKPEEPDFSVDEE